MFVMMNAARLGVGMQSLGLTEVAYQNARAYALERTQGRSLTGPKSESQPADTIIVHPDVRRMLLTARAFAEGGRAFTSYVALMIDRELNHPDEHKRKQAADEVALLTPIALVQMVTPVTTPARLAQVCAASEGFVYAVTMTGTTGKSVAVPDSVLEYLARVRAASPVPVCAGFGIRSAEQVARLSGTVEGVVVGSALVEVLERGEDPTAWLRALRQG